MNKSHGLFGVFALLTAAPVMAGDNDANEENSGTTGSATTSSAKAEKSAGDITVEGRKEDKPICHREIVTGNIRPIRVCLTKEEREERTRQGERTLSDLSDSQRIKQMVIDTKNQQ